ncbi:MAG: DUF4426 domain-containing protein [Pseudomonadales bacterium]
MIIRRQILTTICMLCMTLLLAAPAWAEQKQSIRDYEIHYIVVPTTFLRAGIATQYNLVRGRDRSLINISVLNKAGEATRAKLSGHTRNLLEQRQPLKFDEVREGDAIYYLAVLRHADEEHHRISIDIEFADGSTHTLQWQQKLYWDE